MPNMLILEQILRTLTFTGHVHVGKQGNMEGVGRAQSVKTSVKIF